MRVPFYNISIDLMDHQEVLDQCHQFLGAPRCHTIFFLNAHCFNIAQQQADYTKAISESELLLNDGVGIKLASLAVGVPLKENLNGTDLIPRILNLVAQQKKKVFFLGGVDGVAKSAARQAKEVIPELEVVGWHSGYFNLQQENELIKQINESGAQVLVLGMGVPRQELWAARHREALTNVRLIVGGGAILDFISGHIPRAPLWLRKINMEWVYRFYLEPGRMWKRYTTGIFLFFYNVIRLWPSHHKSMKLSHSEGKSP